MALPVDEAVTAANERPTAVADPTPNAEPATPSDTTETAEAEADPAELATPPPMENEDPSAIDPPCADPEDIKSAFPDAGATLEATAEATAAPTGEAEAAAAAMPED